ALDTVRPAGLTRVSFVEFSYLAHGQSSAIFTPSGPGRPPPRAVRGPPRSRRTRKGRGPKAHALELAELRRRWTRAAAAASRAGAGRGWRASPAPRRPGSSTSC